MLNITSRELARIESQYPGIGETIRRCEEAVLPGCPHCGSADAAALGRGIIGRTIALAAATTKFRLIGDGPLPGEHRCNRCHGFFG
jgi:hypothetical protein